MHVFLQQSADFTYLLTDSPLDELQKHNKASVDEGLRFAERGLEDGDLRICHQL
jgi:hypothetical protein